MKKFALIAALVAVPLVVLAQPVVPGCPNPSSTCSRSNAAVGYLGFLDAGSGAFSGNVSIAGTENAVYVDAGYVAAGYFRSTQASGEIVFNQASGTFSCFNYPTCTGYIRAGATPRITGLAPESDNAYDFGTAALQWRNSNFSGEQDTFYEDAGTQNIGSALTIGKRVTDSATAVTVAACSGGTAASVTWANGTAAFVFDVGTACTGESTAVITLPAANNGWLCSCSVTTADRMLQQKVIPPANGTTVTMQHITISTGASTDFTDSADVGCICRGG